MVDSLTRLAHAQGISIARKTNSEKLCKLQLVKLNNNTSETLRGCFIKLRRIKTNPSVNIECCGEYTAAPIGVVAHALPDQSSCTISTEVTEVNTLLLQKDSSILKEGTTQNHSKVIEKYDNLENNTTLHKQDTQKGCKKVMVRVKRLELNKSVHSPKEKMKNFTTMNQTLSKPNTRNKRISYKAKDYRPNCKCGCAVALQDQCTPLNVNKRTRDSTQNAQTTKKVIVRLERTKIAETKKPREAAKLQKDCKKVMPKGKRVRKVTIAKKPGKEEQVGKSIQRTLDISRFSPVRNSTVFEIGEEAISGVMHEEKSKNVSNENTKDNGSLRNSATEDNPKRKSLTNKPDLIEQLLLTDDDVEELDADHEGHIRNENRVNRHENAPLVNRTNNTHKFFHREPVTELRPKKVSIFEFLSQSDNSETDVAKHDDPAADIINKLISEGRVRVATNHKGTGRPTIKRVRKKPVVKNKKILKIKNNKKANTTDKFDAIKECNENDNAVKSLLPQEPVPHFEYEEDNSNDAHFDEVHNEYQNDAGFSRLARSVLLHQTKKNEITRKRDAVEQRRLLEAARRFVSTPAAANRKNETMPDLSPIQTLTTQHRPACPSPWRIDEDLHLPRVFNFAKNTSYLPTFSSDYIPPTPRKMKPHNTTHTTHAANTTTTHTFIDRNVSTVTTPAATLPTNKTNSESNCSSHNSSGSTYNSNAENMPPPASTPASALNNDENADIFNMRQLPNPRRTLAHRSPLKTINIIEVVNLPPWKKPESNVIEKCSSNNSANSTNDKNDDTHNVDDLFGFEELIDEDSSDVDELLNAVDGKNANRQSIKRNLHNKLKNLKKWRPKKTVHDMPTIPVKPTRLFDEDEGRPKQRLIKEMLCSTMVNQKNAIPEGHLKDGIPVNNSAVFNETEKNAQPIETDFFNDYEPETTLNEKQPRRTYARPIKRKRKAHKNVRYLDYGEFSTDSDDEEENELRKVQQKKKRHEAHPKEKDNPLLESFVNEFNSMCKEVENYELVVE